MSETKKTFGDYLKELRLSKKVSQGKLAAAIGKTTMYISNIEKGKNNPPDESQLGKIADVLNLDEQKRFDLIDAAAAERGTVAQDLVVALAANKKMRQYIRNVISGKYVIINKFGNKRYESKNEELNK